ncbi:MAG: hypothetical protein HQ583_03545 [Candidatus Abyssubacteria bacterium]|nr:hypothetical protein [Candidatus Abyssubacteria bacterium]
MQSTSSVPTQDRKDCIILAIPAGEGLFEVSAGMKEMNIPLCIVQGMCEIEEALSNNLGVLGVVVAQKFLGDDTARAVESIRNIDSELPIVVVASDTNIAFEITMRQMGIFYYLLSPYDREEFFNIVQALHYHNARRSKVRKVGGSN